MLASMSQELRTPLSSSISNMELSLEDSLISSYCKEEYLKPTLTSQLFLLNTINDIIDFNEA